MIEIPKVYDPASVEQKWYTLWESGGYFAPATGDSAKGTFTIVIPPPNVTGMLHMGHALDNTLQDILIRFKRMQGFKTLWVPGTDHAGIATQNVVEKALAKEGKKKEDLGREEFLKKVWEWKEQYGGTITRQLRRLGASCDWSHERFTMDEGLSHAVRKAFVTLYKEGLIYRGKRMVNWCPRCTTAISDIEVEHENKKGHLWHIKYAVSGGKGHVTVATTRPETMLGDTAVAVNPEDPRYKDLVGKKLVLPLVDRKIPVIADAFVSPEFGTGAVKVTPAHDPNDLEMGERHGLEKINIFTSHAKVTLDDFLPAEKEYIKKYEGLTREKAREAIVADLQELGLIEKIEDHENSTGKCYRCKTVIEPYMSDQWFVKVRPLAEKAIDAVEKGDITYLPERWSKVYLEWMRNLRDWCISRQIWWGHRIPVWYCPCGEVIVSETDPERCPECGNTNLKQDEDVLDTWFSSSLWPFSTLGWPEGTSDLKTYYPTSVLITGYDIITFWVSKMIMMGLKFMGKKPFSTVYIHGLIRDTSGKKMSKSLGNVIDPIEVIDHVGADALRFSLTSLVTYGGQDLKLSEEKITEGRNFANKIWNVSRYVLMQGDVDAGAFDGTKLSLADKWVLSRLNTTIEKLTAHLDAFEFGEAARLLYEFIWSEFCDWYVELSKINLYGNINKDNTLKVLRHVLDATMKLLHPFMPFETEEIFSTVSDKGSLMLQKWPVADKGLIDPAVEQEIGTVIDTIRAVRNIRSEMNVPAGKEIKLIISASTLEKTFSENAGYIKTLTKASSIEIFRSVANKPAQSASSVVGPAEIFIPLEGLIDLEKEKQRIQKGIEEASALVARTEAKLANENFVRNAKPELVEDERNKLSEYRSREKLLTERLASLGS